jgi:FkbM family methyltransferase
LAGVGRLRGHSFLALRRGARVVDLGLYKAEFAREMSHVYGAEVIGCEPHPALAESVRAQVIPSLKVHEVAIASQSGSSTLYLGEDHFPTVDTALRAVGVAEETLVRTITFSDFVDSDVTTEWGDEPIELLKIDIEAAEIPLLLDTPAAVLQRFQQITVEFHDFLDERLGPDVELAKQRLRALAFHELRFTLNNEDILYINERFFDAGHMARLALLLRYRIIRGILRRMHRGLLGGEPADRVPAPHKAGLRS